jgi:hypothetical protein
MDRRAWIQIVAPLGLTCALWAQAGTQTGKQPGQAADVTGGAQVRTATTHPMKYLVSLPKHWSPDRKWPVLVAPSSHYVKKEHPIDLFAPERDVRHSDLIIVAPFVINADPLSGMAEYRGPVVDAIAAADAAFPSPRGRNDAARARFDSEGIIAVIKDVQTLYRGDDQVYIAGASSSTHVAYLFLFTHPELLKGVVINSGVYAGRGVDESHIPLLNSPERAALDIKFIVGEDDPGYANNMQNWQETRAKLISYGHQASKMQVEVVKRNNPEHLSAGHTWYPTKILDFCAAVESAISRHRDN